MPTNMVEVRKPKGKAVAGIPAGREPIIVVMPDQRMAVVRTEGDPSVVSEEALSALYGSAYKLKFLLRKQGKEFKVGPLRARWLNAHLVPKGKWQALWGLPVPPDTTFMPPGPGGAEVGLDAWTYGTVAQVLHLGPYSEEQETVERLHRFIREQGYVIAGVHEEEYLTTPRAKVPKIIIRYPVRPRSITRMGLL